VSVTGSASHHGGDVRMGLCGHVYVTFKGILLGGLVSLHGAGASQPFGFRCSDRVLLLDTLVTLA
jgi:hypothetical protein